MGATLPNLGTIRIPRELLGRNDLRGIEPA